jgi:hypothetical protein
MQSSAFSLPKFRNLLVCLSLLVPAGCGDRSGLLFDEPTPSGVVASTSAPDASTGPSARAACSSFANAWACADAGCEILAEQDEDTGTLVNVICFDRSECATTSWGAGGNCP